MTNQDTMKLAKQTPQLKGEAKLRAELAQAYKDIESLSPIELMVRNEGLKHFIDEWTARAVKAEAEVEALREAAGRRGDAGACTSHHERL